MAPLKYRLERGTILVAEPFMLDPNFRRAVVILCDHTPDEGTVGFILNKPIQMNVNELIADFPEFDATVHYGGPVATDTIHYIHRNGEIVDDSIQIGDGMYWGGSFEKLKFLIESNLIKPNDIRFYIGYSGWSPGQLDDEMEIGSWVTNDSHPNYVFKSKHDELWSQTLINKGNTFSVISQMPDSFNLN